LQRRASAMRIGYARVSTHDQNLDLQKDALKKAGCEKVIVDVAGGKKERRSGLDRARDRLRKGDVLVVWRLDRLGRSLKHLIELMNELERDGIGFCSLQESIDTTTSGGKLVFHIFGALAEFERNLIRDRTKAGLDAARARGRRGGRPKALDEEQRALAVGLYEQRKHTVDEICRTLGISKPTLYGYVREKGAGGREIRRGRARPKRGRKDGARAAAKEPLPRSGLVQSRIINDPIHS
jgi:DNA invertase Pin-like site-specific DNA recombinase